MLPNNIKSIFDIMNTFKDNESCISYLESVRWPDGVVSPFNEGSKVGSLEGDFYPYHCISTNKKFSVTTGTLFENTKIPLSKWFMAIFLSTGHKKGISSAQLARDLGVTQKTGWLMLQKIRNCFGQGDEDQLEGIIESDETFCGGKNKNRHSDKKIKNAQGRSFKDKTPVLGLIQRGEDDKPKRVKLFVIDSTARKHIQPLIGEHVKKNSTFYSDEWHAYRGLESRYNHQYIDHSKGQYVDGDIHTNTIEGFWGIFKRGIIGTYHKTSKKHLQLYCNEFQYRYNHMTLSIADSFNCFFKNMNHKLTYKTLTA